jgi:hypothetical protein
VNLGKLQIIAKISRVSGRPLSRPEDGVCFLGTKEEIFSIGGHGILPGFQGEQLLRHSLVGRVDWGTPVHSVHLESLLNVFDGSRKQV